VLHSRAMKWSMLGWLHAGVDARDKPGMTSGQLGDREAAGAEPLTRLEARLQALRRRSRL